MFRFCGNDSRELMQVSRPAQILIVCTGNTCRSPMAEAILNSLLHEHGLSSQYVAVSAGTAAAPGMPAAENAIETMASDGLDLQGHESSPVSNQLVAKASLILTMTQSHKTEMIQRFPEAAARVYTLGEYAGEPFGADWEVDDPVGGSRQMYESCRRDLRSAMIRVVKRLEEGGLT